MYIKRDLAPVRLLTYFSNRRIWSLFKKAWDKDAAGYLQRCYYYRNGAVVNTDNFNRFIRAIGISRSDLTDIDYKGIESAWFEINLPTAPKVTLADIQAEIDSHVIGVEHTITFNVGYRSGYTGTVDTTAVLNSTLTNIRQEILNDNVTFHNSDIIDAHILNNGDGFEEVSRRAYTLVDIRSNLLLVKCVVVYNKVSNGTADLDTVNLLNGDIVIGTDPSTSLPIKSKEASAVYRSMTSLFRNSSHLWTFAEFDSLTKEQFIDLFRSNFDTDYKEEDAEWYEVIIAIVVLVVAIVLAIPSGGISLTSSMAVFATFLGSITLYVSIATFVILQTVGMGAIGLIRIFGKIIEVLGIATAILGVYATIQKTISSAVEHSISFYVKSSLKVFQTYNKFFGDSEETGAKDTTKENQDMINHSNEFIFTKSFETTEIEEHYQLMFDMDRFTHV